MEVILVLLIVAVLNGAIVYIDEMLQELVPMTTNFSIVDSILFCSVCFILSVPACP